MIFIFRGGLNIWLRGRVAFYAPRIVNSITYVLRINNKGNSSWQAQYLVKLDNNTYCVIYSK